MSKRFGNKKGSKKSKIRRTNKENRRTNGRGSDG